MLERQITTRSYWKTPQPAACKIWTPAHLASPVWPIKDCYRELFSDFLVIFLAISGSYANWYILELHSFVDKFQILKLHSFADGGSICFFVSWEFRAWGVAVLATMTDDLSWPYACMTLVLLIDSIQIWNSVTPYVFPGLVSNPFVLVLEQQLFMKNGLLISRKKWDRYSPLRVFCTCA